MNKQRVGLIALLHESNTFLDQPTTMEHFATNVLCHGADVIKAFRDSPHEVGGFIDALATSPEFEAVGLFAARALPYGPITEECWDALMDSMLSELSLAGRLDGLLVAPHGATVAANSPDADGDWLTRVRMQVGDKIPIIGTLDLHANVSVAMANACQALLGYRTNPHLDQWARGQEAGQLMIRTLRGEIWPVQSLVQLPLCVNIERQATSEPQGQRIWRESDRHLRDESRLLNMSCFYGFPYADVVEMGASVLAIADRDQSVARRAAERMALTWWHARDAYQGELLSIEDALDLARREREKDPSRPVGLLDMGDNVGGGSAGDGTFLIHAWHQSGDGELLAILFDPGTVLRQTI